MGNTTEETREERKYSKERALRLGFDLSVRESAPAQFVTVENQFIRETLAPFDEAELPLADVGSLGKVDRRSESLSWAQLGQLYVGRDEWLASEEEEEEDDVKRPRGRPKGSKTKKSNTPKPLDSKILGAYRNFREWLDLRDKARKDLLFLGIDILRHDFVRRVHQEIADTYVQKNFDGVYYKGYTIGDVHKAIDRQERFDEHGCLTKESLILDSRGHFKSTLNRVDCIQWMLNVPDVRILIMTAEKKLAFAFMKAIKGYLYLAEQGTPTDFQLLFPEYVLRKAAGRANTPILLRCRKHSQVEPTLWVNSIDSGLSGWHCDIKKNDDAVNDKNCLTTQTRESLKDQIDNSSNLVDGHGFTDSIGTRYFPDDWYGSRIAIRDDKPLKYFCRACWIVKPGFEDLPLKQLTEDMVVLAFPELSKNAFQVLRGKLLDNEKLFRCQQLNEPALEAEDSFRVTFTEDALRKHLYPMTMAPQDGDLFIAWDWALTHNKNSDYSVGVAARRYQKDGRWGLAILDVRFGRWTPSELAQQIVKMDRDWNPRQTLIEKTPSSELLQIELDRWYKRLDVMPRIWWRTPSVEPDAKRNRIKQLEILLTNDLLWFCFGAWNDEAFTQLTRYTGERRNRGRKDDIPDAMSMLYFFLPTYIPSVEDIKAQEKTKETQRIAMAQAEFHKRIFGGWGDPTPTQAPSAPEDVRPSNDPRNKIFGGNGMHV
jgi:hypothetical protein